MPDNTPVIDRLINKEYALQEQIDRFRRLAATANRLHHYHQRRHFLARMRELEHRYKAIYAQLLKLGESAPYSLYAKQQPQVHGGLVVIVEISLDGLIYSNPAPKVPNGAHVWVRAIIDESHKGQIGVPKTHEMCHITWVYHSSYHRLDTIGKAGRDEYFVSFPLVVTREFTAGAAGSTKHNFVVYVDLYNPVA